MEWDRQLQLDCPAILLGGFLGKREDTSKIQVRGYVVGKDEVKVKLH